MVGQPIMRRLNLLIEGGKMSFTYLFYQHIMLRHSCGKCHFANTRRPSDITIADFWGWEKTDPNINADNKGVSLVLVNTEKGRKLFEAVKDQMTVIPAKLEDCLQPNLLSPTKLHPQRQIFESDYVNKDMAYVMKKYGKEKYLNKKIRSLFLKFKGFIKHIITN